jgi:hypothetical protein
MVATTHNKTFKYIPALRNSTGRLRQPIHKRIIKNEHHGSEKGKLTGIFVIPGINDRSYCALFDYHLSERRGICGI